MTPAELAKINKRLVREWRAGPKEITLPVKMAVWMLVLSMFGVEPAARAAGEIVIAIWRDAAPLRAWLVASL